MCRPWLLGRRPDIVDGGKEQAAVRGPDLAHELAPVVADLVVVVVFDAMTHHGVGDLFQAVIADAVEGIPGQHVGDHADQEPGQQQGADLPEEETPANGIHRVSGFAEVGGAEAGSTSL
jgi:hypothetical protein